MKDFTQKIRLIYLPFLILSIGFVVIYTFLHWLLILKLELFHINEMFIDFWIPFVLPWIPILLILRKRIKLLNLTTKRGDLPGLYMFIAAAAFIAPSIIAQGYIRTASGKLSKLDSVEQVDNSHLVKYYQFDKVYLDKRFTGVYWYVDISGKHNETMNFHGFFTLPIMTDVSDTSKRYFKTWYGLEYRDNISNRLDQSEKEIEYQKFQKRIINEYNNTNLYTLVYFDRIGSNDMHKGLLEAVKVANNYDHSIDPIILKPINEPFENRNGSKFEWIFGSFGIISLVWLIMIIIPAFHESEWKKLKSGKTAKKELKDIKAFFEFFTPKQGFGATPVIIILNTLIFIIMVFAGLGFISFSGKDLLDWGANFRPLVSEGDYWRLFTSTFLHGGFIHLLMNMYGLFFVGIFLEPILKTKRFAIFYIITGLIGSLASIWWHDATVSVGASGAIFGMYGVFLALLLTKLFPKDFQKSFLLSTVIFVGYNLIIGLTGGIDNAAHIGGLLSGMIIGLMIYPKLKKEKEENK